MLLKREFFSTPREAPILQKYIRYTLWMTETIWKGTATMTFSVSLEPLKKIRIAVHMWMT